jgi:hypothetical protein
MFLYSIKSAGLAKAATGQQQPGPPIAFRRMLIGPPPPAPIMLDCCELAVTRPFQALRRQHSGDRRLSACSAVSRRTEIGEIGETGFDLNLTGFGEFELGELCAERTQGRTDPDDAPELPAHPVAEPSDLWVLGRHRSRACF